MYSTDFYLWQQVSLTLLIHMWLIRTQLLQPMRNESTIHGLSYPVSWHVADIRVNFDIFHTFSSLLIFSSSLRDMSLVSIYHAIAPFPPSPRLLQPLTTNWHSPPATFSFAIDIDRRLLCFHIQLGHTSSFGHVPTTFSNPSFAIVLYHLWS